MAVAEHEIYIENRDQGCVSRLLAEKIEKMSDRWGESLRLEQDQDVLIVVSCGPDRSCGTEDDMRGDRQRSTLCLERLSSEAVRE
jgi:hypothetical protein